MTGGVRRGMKKPKKQRKTELMRNCHREDAGKEKGKKNGIKVKEQLGIHIILYSLHLTGEYLFS